MLPVVCFVASVSVKCFGCDLYEDIFDFSHSDWLVRRFFFSLYSWSRTGFAVRTWLNLS